MASVKIELNSAGIIELLKSEEIAAVCEEQAEIRTRATGVDYVADVHVGKTRVNAAGYDFEKDDGGSYRKRTDKKTGRVKTVYTQRRIKSK